MHPKLQAAIWLVRQLRGCEYARVADEATLALASALEIAEFSRGHVLYKPHVLPDAVWVIRSGSVELSSGTGRTRTVVQRLRAGDLVGDVYLVTGSPPPLTARVADPGRFLRLSADRFRDLLQTHPTVASLWMANLCLRLAHSRVRMLELLAPLLHQRLARLLLEETENGVLHMSQAAMAQMLGAQRSSVNRILKRLEAEGVVELHYARVELKDRDELEALASGDAQLRAKLLAEEPNVVAEQPPVASSPRTHAR